MRRWSVPTFVTTSMCCPCRRLPYERRHAGCGCWTSSLGLARPPATSRPCAPVQRSWEWRDCSTAIGPPTGPSRAAGRAGHGRVPRPVPCRTCIDGHSAARRGSGTVTHAVEPWMAAPDARSRAPVSATMHATDESQRRGPESRGGAHGRSASGIRFSCPRPPLRSPPRECQDLREVHHP